MRKDNRKSVFVVIALILVAVGSYFVAGTYAKYTSEVSGTSNTSIAGWKWIIGTEDLKDIIDNKESKYTLNLFDTITEVDETDEEHVSTSNVAPGTAGKFTIDIANKSQVDATYAYNLEVTNNLGAKIQWSTDGTTYTDDITTLSKTATDIAKENGTASATIYWKWVFYETDTQDAADTEVGLKAGAAAENDQDIVVTATLVLTQVD